MGPDKRQDCGMKGREFVTSDKSMMTGKAMSQNFIDHMDGAFENWKPKKRFTLYKT